MTSPVVLAFLVFPLAADDDAVRSTVEHSVTVVRHGAGTPASEAAEEAPEMRDFQRRLLILARLQSLGLVHVRPVEVDRTGRWWDDPPWKYTPKRYHGYHAKPAWRTHARPGWRYDADRGWSYVRQPRWHNRPGALDTLLAQLPTEGPGWYVTKWR